MSRQRQISWSAALQDMRSDRIRISPEDRRQRIRKEIFAKVATNRARKDGSFHPLSLRGQFDHRTIMRAAVAAAQARRSTTGEDWHLCMAAALTGTWSAAKLLHRLANHNALRSVVTPEN